MHEASVERSKSVPWLRYDASHSLPKSLLKKIKTRTSQISLKKICKKQQLHPLGRVVTQSTFPICFLKPPYKLQMVKLSLLEPPLARNFEIKNSSQLYGVDWTNQTRIFKLLVFRVGSIALRTQASRNGILQQVDFS